MANPNLVAQIVAAKITSPRKDWTRVQDLVTQSVAIVNEIESQCRGSEEFTNCPDDYTDSELDALTGEAPACSPGRRLIRSPLDDIDNLLS